MKKFKTIICSIIDKNNLKKIFPVILLLLLATLVIGITYAIYNASFTGGYNTITIGSISMSYTESTNVIAIENALPVSDKEGKESSNYFDFSVSSNSNTIADIYYEINIEKLDVDTGYNTLENKDIKVYLENKDNNEVLVDPVLISDLSNSYLNENYWLLYANTHSHSENNVNITTNYRLRAWIDYDTDASSWSETNRYEYKFRVNINTNENNSVSGFASECFTYKLDNETMTATITDYLCGEDSVEQLSYTNKNYYVMPLATTLENSTAITDFEVPESVYIKNDIFYYYIDLKKYEDEEMVNKCVNNVMSLANEEDDMTEEELEEIETMYRTLCSGGSLYGEYYTLSYFAISEPEIIEEMGLVEIGMAEKVGGITYKVVENPTEEAINNCITVITNIGMDSYSEIICNVGDNPDESFLALLLEGDTSIYGIILANTGMIETKTTAYKPDFLKNYSITQIGDKAFYGKGLTNITLSDGIISIGAGAFTDNKIPEENAYFYARTDSDSDGVAEIDYTTLVSYGGTGENVIIPDSVTTIGNYAFNYEKLSDTSLITVELKRNCFTHTIDNSNVTITDWTCTDIYNPIIPDKIDGNTVTIIGDKAFYSNSLKKITIPNSVITIGDYAFQYNNLTSIDLGSGIKSIGNWTFCDNKLETVTIPDSVTTIGGRAFQSNNLTSITIPNSVTSLGYAVVNGNKLPDDDAYIYYRKDKNKDGVAEIDYSTIISYGGAKSDITIPSVAGGVTVTDISYYAFQSSNLTSVVIPDTIKIIGDDVFSSNNNLTSIVVDSNNTIYDSRNNSNAIIETSTNKLIQGCKNTIIPNDVTSIGASAFYGMGLTTIEIPNSVVTIENSAFYGNDLTSITIPNSVTTIGSWAFSSNDLEYVVIGENSNLIENTGIENYAFWSFYNSLLSTSDFFNSNINLKTIYNNSGKSFDFSNAITGDEGTPFVTGTITSYDSKIVTITTGYPE